MFVELAADDQSHRSRSPAEQGADALLNVAEAGLRAKPARTAFVPCRASRSDTFTCQPPFAALYARGPGVHLPERTWWKLRASRPRSPAWQAPKSASTRLRNLSLRTQPVRTTYISWRRNQSRTVQCGSQPTPKNQIDAPVHPSTVPHPRPLPRRRRRVLRNPANTRQKAATPELLRHKCDGQHGVSSARSGAVTKAAHPRKA